MGVTLVGALLLLRFREATLTAAAERQLLLVEARARQLSDELEALAREIARLSQLAEVDLADGNLEPEKTVLRVARRDSAVLSVAIVILDERGDLLWAEPRQARPPADGAALVGLARGRGRPVERFTDGEMAVAAPVAGRGAIAAVVDGRRGHDVFGATLQRGMREHGLLLLVHREREAGEIVVAEARRGEVPPLGLDRPGQAWRGDAAGRRWLVSEAAVGETGLTLRQVLSAPEVEGELSAPFRRLVALVAAAVVLAVAIGLALALVVRRLERAELELHRARDLAAMGQTAAAIAHEVKNALNGLSMGVDLLASGRADPGTATTVHRRARAEIGRLREVAEDLTLFAAAPRLTQAPLDLAALCRQASEAVQELADDCGVLIRLDLPEALPAVGDGPKLLGALVNLARNGIESMGPGAFGERLGEASPAADRVVELKARRDGPRAVVEVADRGAGLAAEVRHRLFEPFVTTKRGGTGLGLVIAQRVVAAHGGRVSAAEREGGGTIFRLELPVAEAA
jgi:two-component system C4-dicarboxylate transport sensor histidine kinase DctB